MNTTFPPAIEPLPVQQATQKVWALRHLHRAGALDTCAGRLALAPLSVHPNDRVARLAIDTLIELDPPIPTPSPDHLFDKEPA